MSWIELIQAIENGESIVACKAIGNSDYATSPLKRLDKPATNMLADYAKTKLKEEKMELLIKIEKDYGHDSA